MADAKIWDANVTLTLSLTMNESEARALVALACYGTDNFLKTFYEHMGTSELRPHEAALRSLFAAVGQEVVPMLRRADKARKTFVES